MKCSRHLAWALLFCCPWYGSTSKTGDRVTTPNFFGWYLILAVRIKPKYHGTDLDFFWIKPLPGRSSPERIAACTLLVLGNLFLVFQTYSIQAWIFVFRDHRLRLALSPEAEKSYLKIQYSIHFFSRIARPGLCTLRLAYHSESGSDVSRHCEKVDVS